MRLLTLITSLLLTSSCLAQLTYNTPTPNSAIYPRGVALSTHYHVMVKAATDPSPWQASKHSTASYKFWPDYLDPETLPFKHKNTAVHVAQFDSDERVKIRVELLEGTEINSIKLKPSRYVEMRKSQIHGKTWVEFELEPYHYTKHVLIEFNPPEKDTDALQDGLMVFFNPLSQKPKGRVLTLPAGVINEKSPFMDEFNRILIDEHSQYDAIYIPQNTIIDGRVEIRKPNFTVSGRGIIAGSRWPFVKAVPNWREVYPRWISPDGKRVKPLLANKVSDEVDNSQSYFEGVTVVHPYHFCVGYAETNDNLKAFGWRYSSDGIHGHTKRGSFMRVNDDATYVNNGLIEDNTYWGMVNGAVFQLGWSLKSTNDTPVYVRRVNIVRGEWDNSEDEGIDRLGAPKNAKKPQKHEVSANRGVFIGTYRDATAGSVSHKYFEDIRVDGQVNRLFYLGSLSGLVSYEHFHFKDIWFEKTPSYDEVTNVLAGHTRFSNITFDNFVVADRKVMSLDDVKPLSHKNIQSIQFK